MGTVIYQSLAHRRGSFGLAPAPNVDLLISNGDAVKGDPNSWSGLHEFTPVGQFVGRIALYPAQGATFGLALNVAKEVLTVATVNDDTRSLTKRVVSI